MEVVEVGFWAGALVFLMTPWIFITLISVGIIGQLILIEYEQFGWNTVILVALLILLNFKYDLVTYIMNNPLGTCAYTGGYFGVGLIWSFGKWYSKISKIGRKVSNVRKRYQEKWGLKKFHEDIAKELGETFYGYQLDDGKTFTQWIKENVFPKASENKSLITAWIIYWPISAIATLINDPVRRIANWLYYKFSAVYQYISDMVENSAIGDDFDEGEVVERRIAKAEDKL